MRMAMVQVREVRMLVDQEGMRVGVGVRLYHPGLHGDGGDADLVMADMFVDQRSWT
jgi:hypothetical protein